MERWLLFGIPMARSVTACYCGDTIMTYSTKILIDPVKYQTKTTIQTTCLH